MRGRFALLSVCLLLAACGGKDESPVVEKSAAIGKRQQPPRSTKVTWKISGSHLESEALNFRIDAPAGFTWRNEKDDDDQYLFVARNGSDTVRLLIQGRNHSPATENRTYDYVNGMRGAYELRGMAVQDVLVSRRRSKLGSGYFYFFRAVRGNNAARVTGYLVASDRLYSLEHVSAMPTDVLGPFIASLAPAR
ncbi:MAG TPA: hypothetical protein VF266_00825 [Thermoanaerobaculia bacterium]